MMIPNVVHFCFGFDATFGGKPFCLAHYLAVRAAHLVNRPSRICFHYKYEPEGFWWARAKPYLTLMPCDPPEFIFGKPVLHHAHHTDSVRLQVLWEHGGIYLDMDVICLRPFSRLLGYSCVLGREDEDDRGGLCNAVILAEKSAPFVKLWLEGFNPATSHWEGFRARGRDAHWGEMAVKYPALMAQLHPDLIHSLDHRAFFWPLFYPDHLRTLFEGTGAVLAESYCIHLWETFSYEPYLKPLTVADIRGRDTSFNVAVRPFLENIDVDPL